MKRPEADMEATELKRLATVASNEPSRKKQRKLEDQNEKTMDRAFTANGGLAVVHVSRPTSEGRSSSATLLQDSNSSDGDFDSGSGDESPKLAAVAPKQKLPPSPTKKLGGVVLKSGRIRLPDKLMEYLNNQVAPDVLFWQKDGISFSFDINTAQTELLDKYFSGTKLTSFTRSLNRWGFKRVFHALAPKNVLSYEHPSFLRDQPEKVKELNMANANDHAYVPVPAKSPNAAPTAAPKASAKNTGNIHSPLGSPPTRPAVSIPPLAILPQPAPSSGPAMASPQAAAQALNPSVAGLLDLALGQPLPAPTAPPSSNAQLPAALVAFGANGQNAALAPSIVGALLSAVMPQASQQGQHQQHLYQSQPQTSEILALDSLLLNLQQQPHHPQGLVGASLAASGLASLLGLMGGQQQQQQQPPPQPPPPPPQPVSFAAMFTGAGAGTGTNHSMDANAFLFQQALASMTGQQISTQQPVTNHSNTGSLQQQLNALVRLQQQLAPQQQQQPQLQAQQAAATTAPVLSLQQSLQVAIDQEQQRQAAIQAVMGVLARRQREEGKEN